MARSKDATQREIFIHSRALNNAIVKALHDGGAHLLLGTDAVKPSVLPGFSLQEELEKFAAHRYDSL